MSQPAFTFIAVADLPEKPRIRHGHCWGVWRLNARNWTLMHELSRYEIDLEAMSTSATMLDCLFQVTQKMWCSPHDAGQLIEALRALLNPQATLCRYGREHFFQPTPHLKALLAKGR